MFPSKPLTTAPDLLSSDWNEVTKEQVLDGTHGADDAMWVYAASKAVAERELWKFADAHPEVDITTILPSAVYGPIAPGIKLTKEGLANYSTAGWLYEAVLPPVGQPAKLKPVQDTVPITVDVRDVAKAHVLALSASEVIGHDKHKRLLVAGETFLFKEAVEHLASVRPELRGRLPDASEAKSLLAEVNTMDTSRTQEVLGITFIDWRKTVEDSVQSYLEIEKSWVV